MSNDDVSDNSELIDGKRIDDKRFDGKRIDGKRIEEAGLNGLQTQRQLFYDGWLLRVSPGKAKRARSVNAHFGSTLPLPRKVAYCERLYAERGLPVLFRMTPYCQPADLESALAARGYIDFEPTLVQTLALPRPPECAPVVGVVFRPADPPTFAEAAGALQDATVEQRAAYLERLAQSPLPTRAVVANDESGTLGTGLAMLEDGMAGIFTMATAEPARRRGIASAILADLLTWAWEHGATQAYLQVSADNHPAIAVYRQFGFATTYTYHYRGREGECH